MMMTASNIEQTYFRWYLRTSPGGVADHPSYTFFCSSRIAKNARQYTEEFILTKSLNYFNNDAHLERNPIIYTIFLLLQYSNQY